ncbi:MAG: MFS transporter [Chloroflexota bacterium]|nr:MAG: MFS transporter [Chloroflexota bacterium]
MMNESSEPRFSWWLLLRICTFQIGSAMGDILVTSIWNRIMIVNFGFPALPVGLLIALRYLLSPLSLYAGFRSDTTPFLGMRRTSYIWLGRALMVISFPLLGFSVTLFNNSRNDSLGWALALLSFLLYGTGTLLSGSPFFALVRDAMPKARQGLALSVVETALILFFPIAAISFSLLLQDYSLVGFWELIAITALVGGFFWVFAIAGVEKRAILHKAVEHTQEKTRAQFQEFHGTLAKIWQDPRARAFMLFLAVATFSAWAQDAILEPFGAEVLNATIAQTTRYSSYWQGATALVLIIAAYVWRKRRPEQQTPIAKIGLAIMGLGMAWLALTSLTGIRWMVNPALLVFGVGFGFYTFSAFQLLVVMTSDKAAGAYLGLWTVTILLTRGVGIFMGGALRDGLYALTQSHALAYGIIFGLEGLGLFVSILLLARVNIIGFARDTGRISATDAQVITADL